MFDMSLHHVICLVLFSVFQSPVFAQNDRDIFRRGKRPLPMDGDWSSWAPWSECYLNSRNAKNFYPLLESFFIQTRNRSCNNPVPLHGGKECTPPSHRFKQCACMNPLGMATRLINDSQITSSSYYPGYPPREGRLGGSNKGWCSRYRPSLFKKTYIEIDFEKFVNIGAIDISGNERGRVSYFKAEYSLNGKEWKNIVPEDGGRRGVFKGNLVPRQTRRANFSGHKVMKHLRVSPTKSYNMPCLKVEPIGCMFTCGELHTASFGKISANSRVDIDQNCLWRIEVRNTSALSFDLTTFDILCKHGYLDFHDGSFEFTNSPLLKRICLRNYDQELSLLKINNNMVWLNFVSNSSDLEDSFTLKYFSECKQTINLEKGESRFVKSPNYPNSYFGNLDCSWTLNVPKGEQQVDLNFRDFSVENSKNSCLDDSLTIKYFLNDIERTLGRFCDSNKPKINYTITADKVFFKFKSDPIQKTGKGFQILVQSGHKLILTTQDPTSTDLSTIASSLSPVTGGNKSFVDFPREKKKKNNDDDSDWTIIIVSAFSAIVFLLICWVLGMSIRRFINNRNEVEAHCKKVKAQNEEKLLKEKNNKSGKMSPNYQPGDNHIEVLLSPSQTLSPQPSLPNSNANKNDIEGPDEIENEASHLLSSETTYDLQTENNVQDKRQSTCAEVDTPIEYDNSVQIHSPVKSCSTPDVSVKMGNNNSDTETCV